MRGDEGETEKPYFTGVLGMEEEGLKMSFLSGMVNIVRGISGTKKGPDRSQDPICRKEAKSGLFGVRSASQSFRWHHSVDKKSGPCGETRSSRRGQYG